ncbi:MAG: EAL domain-containing protein [Cyanobacteria bacterium J06639_16]
METDTNPVPSIPGYVIVEQLSKGSRAEVYRALQQGQQPVVIKVLRHEHPSFEELVQFRNQYAIARRLNHPKIACPLALERCGNGYALVMPDEGFVALSVYWQQRDRSGCDVSGGLAIASQLAEALHYLTEQRILHKDIKPDNILIHPETGQIKLIDFSLASLLPEERQQFPNPNLLEGTLAYISPEQTGRMNRGIDYRTDFYSLGVTLFELLVGELPFQTADPMGLVHCHIAHPVQFSETSQQLIPERVRAIILKLMAKNAEDRYQSALGLKHDLDICLQQWDATGDITAFELGERDTRDRFLIPARLYGREKEVQLLLDAFERVAGNQASSELMLVAGFSGIGKTAVINKIHKPITRQNGYFIKGKFDQFNRNIPLLAFVQALQDLIGQLLSNSDAQLTQWRTQILDAVGENSQVLIELIPELRQVIGQQPAAPELSGTAAQNRFNWLFQKLIAVFATAEQPLVMFLDDLHWADSASLKLIKVLMDNESCLLLLGAYREHEVSPTHPLRLTTAALMENGKTVNTITLAPLTLRDTNQFVADTLGCSTQRSRLLAELLNRKTQGNPFFISRFLKALHEDGYIQFDRHQGHWDCDVTQINAPYLTDDILEFMTQQLHRLPLKTQQALKLAACLGNQFDLATLSLISEQSQTDTAAALWKARQEGLILPVNEIYKFFQDTDIQTPPQAVAVSYRFLHDQIQQAAYALIPEVDKSSTHLKIGRLIIDQISESELEPRLFDIANNISLGKALINHPIEQYRFGRLLLRAACKAKAATAYTAAAQYCQTGITILGQQAWQNRQTLMRELYEVGAEVTYLNSDFERSEAFTDIALEKANSVLETIKSCEIKILAYIIQNKTLEGLEIGFKILSELGITFPSNPDSISILSGFFKTKLLLWSHSIKSIEGSSIMKNPLAKARSAVIKAILPAAYISAPNLYPLLIFKQIELLLKYGNNDAAPSAYCSYGVILSNFLGDIETGYKFGELALRLMSDSIINKVEAGVNFTVYALIRPWKHHLNQSMSALFANYHHALESGENEYAAWSILTYLRNARSIGMELNENAKQHAAYIKILAKTQRSAVVNYAYPSYLFTLKLLDRDEILADLDSKGLDQASLMSSLTDANDRAGLCAAYLYQLMLAYWLRDFGKALESITLCQKYLDSIIGFYEVQQYWWFATLTWLAVYPQAPDSKQRLRQIHQSRKKLKKWAHHAPMNAQHKFHLVEAERYRVLKKMAIAADLYDRAISGAKDNGYIQEEALANELAAKFYLAWGKEKAAAGYLQAAYYCYAHWGAKAKTDDLARRYPELLQPVLQQAAPNPLETLVTIAAPNLSIHGSTDLSHASGYNFNTTLDFAAALKASQALSQSIRLDELLRQFTQIILKNSGADRCALIRPNSTGGWQVKAIATPQAVDLCSEPLAGNSNLPIKLIQYVKNTYEAVVIDDLNTDLPIIDDYLSQHRPRSLLCLPIHTQGRLIGILYLSNQSTSGVFTYDRILILNFLCTQAAISLENARLYQTLENYSQTLEAKVEERTTALRENEERLGLALRATNQGFFDLNLQTDEAIVSSGYALMLGYDPATFHETAATWRSRLHPDDQEQTSQAYRAYEAGQTSQYIAEFRQQTQQGDWKWILSMGQFVEWDRDGRPIRLLGTHTDISDRKFAETQLQDQNELLAQIAQGQPLPDVLNALIDTVERSLDGVLCSVLLLGKDNRLRFGAAPNLPADYNQVTSGVLIGEGVGSCGTAAFRNQTVIVADIATDSLWCPYKDLALSHGLRACWSSPITASGGEVLGTFAMYYQQVRSPQSHELKIISQMAHIAGIAIERQQAEARLRRSEATLLEAQQIAHIGNWEFDIPSQTVTWSPEMFRMFGLPPAQSPPSYAEYLQMLPVDDRLRLQQYVERAIAEAIPYTIEYSRVRPDGSLSHHECRAEVEQDSQGQVMRLYGTVLDITERKQAELALQNLIAGTAATTGQDFFPALVQHISEALNVSYAIVTEKIGDQLQTLAFWANGVLVPPHTYALAQTPCELVLQTGEFYCSSNVQQWFPDDPDLVELEAESYLGIVLPNNQGQAIGHLCILHQQPITNLQRAKQILRVFAARAAAELERQQSEALITHNALHDPLTGLPNRTLLLERLALAINHSQRIEDYRYAVLFLDLDRFKVINDSLGHVIGDQLLVAIAQRLKTHLRQMDLVARLGGDEFLILLEDTSSTEEVVQIAERILADCQTPLTIDIHKIFTGISIGIVLGTTSYHRATDLIRDADIAMYRAKTQASNSYKFFDATMHTQALNRLTLETDLRKALAQEEFIIHYQPIFDLHAHRLVGFEALARWQHPTRGLIFPDNFVSIAEETGLIASLDSWVIHQACQQIVSWQDKFTDYAPLKVSVNLSAQDLSNANLIQDIDDILATTGLAGDSITLEITESMLIEDIDQTIDLLAQLASRQIQISIDDFGTGYSSLNYLHRLPVHSLKIDRCFVSQMQAENRNYQVVKTIITLSNQLGLITVAEGIETSQQLQRLQQLGCQLGQGYLFSKPLTPPEIESHFLQ